MNEFDFDCEPLTEIPAFCSGQNLADQLRQDGWLPGPPKGLNQAHLEIDRRCCQECDCQVCGHAGLIFAAWHRGREYNVTCTCPTCNHSMTF